MEDTTKLEEREVKPELKALRDGFGEGLLAAAKENANVVALCADLTESDRMEEFRITYPDRFVEIGIAEQNLVGVAAGMAHAGKVPFAASFAALTPGRSWDQIRVSCCYSNANVKLYGGHAGITVGEDGATHQALEDIAITRVIPRMTVIVPCDALEMKKATLAAARMQGPVYLRGGRPKIPVITEDDDPFVIGKANQMLPGKDVTIIACGLMVGEALTAARKLREQKISAAVLNIHTIKPIDEDAIIDAASRTGAIVTAEEHQITGGLGSAVSEVLGAEYPVPIERVGMMDMFGESGTWDALLDKYGFRWQNIVEAVIRVLDRKDDRKKPRKIAKKVMRLDTAAGRVMKEIVSVSKNGQTTQHELPALAEGSIEKKTAPKPKVHQKKQAKKSVPKASRKKPGKKR
jgi:transketolase